MIDLLLVLGLLAAVGAGGFWAGTRRHRTGRSEPGAVAPSWPPPSPAHPDTRARRGTLTARAGVWRWAVTAGAVVVGIIVVSWLVPGPGLFPSGLFGPASGPGGLLGRGLP